MSVVVPTYNRPRYLAEALDSLLAQSFNDFEAIVGNDGNHEIVRPLRERYDDPRITWIDNPVRKGVLANMVDCFARTRGRYVAQLHDDDRWSPALLASLVPPLDADERLSVAFCDHFIIDEHGQVEVEETEANSARWSRNRLSPGAHRPFRRMAVVEKSIPAQCAAVYRRDALDLDDFPAPIGPYFDLWISYQLARDGAGALYVPRRLAYIRAHAGTQTATGRLQNERAGLFCYERFLADPRLHDVPRAELLRAHAAHQYGVAVSLLRQGERAAARSHLRRSVTVRPRPRTALALAASLLPDRMLARL